ncbi:heparan-alpha-glucosaminide N-acetyltransferase domain-containing protein [Microvirga mediterraneensis]|uniref:Acyltransferase n=1 Tax=Microvirga mediterraneensis TaxID=2754695 RepID=A0A838BUL7_9HYPH|nr:acyltransferase [Microvirga mediterraneensis]
MQRDRLDFLDNLRGIAALYVLLFHVYCVLTPNLAPPPAISSFIGFGYSWVWLFFAISAFSLSLTMPRHIATGMPLTSFAASRFSRIAPLFYVLIIYSTLHYCLTTGKPPAWGLIAGSVSFLFNFFQAGAGVPFQGDGPSARRSCFTPRFRFCTSSPKG